MPNESAQAGPLSGRLKIKPPVFFVSAGLILLVVFYGAIFTEQAAGLFARLQAEIIARFGWLYIAAVAGFLLFALFLMFSRYGDIKLGPDDSEPDYSYASWFAMLFSAGMGIGLMFFGVAEPILHYVNPPQGEGGTIAAAREAMVLTFFHWGLHAWAIYIVVGLALAYFAFRQGLPLTLRSALYPLIGDRIHGPIGHTVDIFAVLGTMFGVATSLGLGVMQVNAGLAYLVGVPIAVWVQVLLIAAITGMATVSVFAGLDRGIRRLSQVNVALAMFLLLFVLATGPTLFLLTTFVQNIGAYLGAVVPRTFRMYAYEPTAWIGDWTLFYWGWWIAWSPFVGMFIARISRGRSIREFVLGVLLVPVLFTFLWMTVFGNTALWQELNGIAPMAQIVSEELPVALFALFAGLPFSALISGVATLLVITFFVTSADSGALVIDMITSGGDTGSPAWQRVMWALMAGVVAAVLLLAGGLQALQTAAIASALPFVVVMIFICYGLLRALQIESVKGGSGLAASAADSAAHMTWEQRLDAVLRSHDHDELKGALRDVAQPALDEIAERLRTEGLEADTSVAADRIDLVISHGRERFRYCVRVRGYKTPSFAFPEQPSDKDSRHFRLVVHSSNSDQQHDVTGFTRVQLLEDFVARYGRFRQSRHSA